MRAAAVVPPARLLEPTQALDESALARELRLCYLL